MAIFRPIQAYRPDDSKLPQIAQKSSDFPGKKALVHAIRENKLSYLNLTNAHQLSENADNPQKAFDHAQRYIESMFEDGHFVEDDQDCYYVYRQTGLQRSCTGVLGRADIEEYDNNIIKKHELTRTNSEHLIAELFRNTRVLGEPVLLGHLDHHALAQTLREVTSSPPDCQFRSEFGENHELWLVKDESKIEKIQEQVAEIESLYIMDGHHRMAALSNLHSFNPEEKGRYFLANLVAESELHIGPFHRKVEGVEIDVPNFLIELSHIFDIQSFGSDLKIYNPGQRNEFGMLLDGNWYSIKLRNPHHLLDVTILESEILAPVFDILNTQTDPRLHFIKNVEEMEVIDEMKSQPDCNSVLFTLHPCSFDEIRTVSEQGGTMPPKSTYIQPRSRPGLVVQKFR